MLLGKARRAAADAVSIGIVAVTAAVAMAVAGLRDGGTGKTERRGAGDEKDLFQSLTIVDLTRLNVR